MQKDLMVKVTLAGTANRVNSQNYEWFDYRFPKAERKRAFEIVKSSLYPYPVTQIEVSNDGYDYVVATLKGPVHAFFVFREDELSETNNIYLSIVKDLAYNYGDGGHDGWMEGDIFIDPTHQLWLDLVKVEFYKDGQLFLLFDDSDTLNFMGTKLLQIYWFIP